MPALETILVATFSKSISLGAVIISVMLGLATMSGLFYGVRFRTLAQMQALTIDALGEERDNQTAIAARLEQQTVEQKMVIAEQAAKLLELEKLPNMTQVIDVLKQVLESTDSHAQRRHEETIAAISKIGINQAGS